jgi:hypothetical protein
MEAVDREAAPDPLEYYPEKRDCRVYRRALEAAYRENAELRDALYTMLPWAPRGHAVRLAAEALLARKEG